MIQVKGEVKRYGKLFSIGLALYVCVSVWLNYRCAVNIINERTTITQQLHVDVTLPVVEPVYDQDFWAAVASERSGRALYSADTDVDGILRALTSAKIVAVRLVSPEDAKESDAFSDFGSTHKWILELEGGQKAIFKPQWYGRNHTQEFWSDGFELHTSEIVSFHVDRILGFRKVPFTVGRRINISEEIVPLASAVLKQHLSHNGSEWCLSGRCYFCEADLTTCTTAGRLEGSLTYFVSGLSPAHEPPWGPRNIHKHLLKGFNHQVHCAEVFSQHAYLREWVAVLELVDLAVLDHITYHFDSKIYWMVEGPGAVPTTGYNTSRAEGGGLVYLDHGRALTSFNVEETRNLLPLWQCCRIREKTWKTLNELARDGLLTTRLRDFLSHDSISPPAILDNLHYVAIETRLKHILKVVDDCLTVHDVKNVIIS